MSYPTDSLGSYLASSVASSRLSDKYFSIYKFSANGDVDTIAKEDVWDVGGIYQYLDSAFPLDIVSDSAQDSSGGTGIESVRVFGLDSDYNLIEEDVVLNGLTPVSTSQSFIRTYRMLALTPGTAGDYNAEAAGNISATGNGVLQARILTGNTSTRMSMFTIPAGYTGFITQIFVSGGPNDDFVVDFKSRVDGGVFVTGSDVEVSNSLFANVNLDPTAGGLQGPADIKLKAQAINNNAAIRASYNILMIRNDYLATLSRK